MSSAAAADLVERAAQRRVLVFGSLPPAGRDLDVLVPDDDLAVLSQALAGAGFETKGQEWARFRDCGVESVELVPVSDWGLPAAEAERLFEDAVALPERRRLAEPSPADQLLILARRHGPHPSALQDKHRARIDRALAAEPLALTVAMGRTEIWDADRELAALMHVHEKGAPASPPLRTAVRRKARRVRFARERRGAIVALSGLDGSGKSTQAEALAATLRGLGHDAEVEWSRITHDTSLDFIAGPAKVVLAVTAAVRRRAPEPPPDDPSTYVPRGSTDAAARVLRARYPLLNQGWASVVAGVHAWGQRRRLLAHLRRGRVVVRDRYVLDSVVQLRQMYGHRHGVDLPVRIMRWLSPPALVSFWLDVPAEVAYARKPEQFSVDRLAARRPLYEEELERAGATRLDGTRPVDELCAEIARETWRRLP